MNPQNPFQSFGFNLSVISPLIGGSSPMLGQEFSNVAEHAAAISEVQRFRGRIYAMDGAIPPEALDEEGRHYQHFDLENYHLCIRDKEQRVRGCLRLRLHQSTVQVCELKLYEVIKRMPSRLAGPCHAALESIFEASRVGGVRIGEVGGWAVDEELRHHRVSILLPIAAWSLYQTIGNALVISSATTRHQSSEILKRIGGFPLQYGGKELPRFADDYHGCEMELLEFDSRRPHPKYENIVAELKAFLSKQVRTPSAKHRDLTSVQGITDWATGWSQSRVAFWLQPAV